MPRIASLTTIFILGLLCFCGNAIAAETVTNNPYDPVAVYLTWQRSPESTMTINWITPFDRQNDLVEYRLAENENAPWQQATGSHTTLPNKAPYFLHRIELTGLQPETTYQFRTGSDATIYKFQTMPATLDHPVRFAVGGDMYHDTLEILHETNRQAAKTAPSFVLVGGDIAYASDKIFDYIPRWFHGFMDKVVGQKFDRWLEWLVAWKQDMVKPDGCLIPMIPAIGNHDTIGRYAQTPEQAPFFYALFPMPGLPGYNVLDFGSYMSFFLLDTNHTNPVGGKQAQWLAEAMKQRENIPRKFALYHVPAYPSVHKFSQELGVEIRKFWVPTFDTYHLTAAFENHEHAYKRTHPLRGNAIDVDGVMYIGDGGWGVDKPRTPRYLQEKWYLAKTASARHFLVVDVDQDKQTVHAINSDGIVIDSFSWPE